MEKSQSSAPACCPTVPGCPSEEDSLRLRVYDLENELEEKTENLFKAAEFGKSLLGTNQLLNDKLDATESEYSKQLEVTAKYECMVTRVWPLFHAYINPLDSE